MANEEQKDFNAMLRQNKDMPKIQILKDPASIQKYGGEKMYFAPPMAYDALMRQVPRGALITVGAMREHLAEQAGADFTGQDETPYWRTLKAGGELNPKYPGGQLAQKEKLEAEGHEVLQKGRKNIKYYVKEYEKALFELK